MNPELLVVPRPSLLLLPAFPPWALLPLRAAHGLMTTGSRSPVLIWGHWEKVTQTTSKLLNLGAHQDRKQCSAAWLYDHHQLNPASS